jgi:hypothetical protein
MITMAVAGLDWEQVENICRALPVEIKTQLIPHVNGTWGVAVEGRVAALDLIGVLINEDSGADYLV